jgi:integrase
MTTPLRPATLHNALDAYTERIRQQAGASSASSAQSRLSIVRRLKAHHDDLLLAAITLDECIAMLDSWRNRPVSTTTGKPIAASTARQTLSELVRFFGWLDASSQFEWAAPAHFGQVSRRVMRLASDRKHLNRDAFSVEHLAALYHHATPMQRLMLCLAMNCGMGAAEMGRLDRSDFIFDDSDEFVIDLLSGEGLLRFVSPKTGAHSEWLLWPETVVAAKWAIARASERGSEVIFASDDGKTMWRDQTANPSCVFRYQWRQLLDSVEDHGVPSLPLGTIRKQMAERLRREHGDHITPMFLGHVPTGVRDTHHLVRSFRPLHEALRQLRASLATVFDRPA